MATALPNLFEGGGTRMAGVIGAHGSWFAGKGHEVPQLAVPPLEMRTEPNGPPLRRRRSAPAGRRATGAALWPCLALLFAAPSAFAVAPGANRVEARLLTPISTYSTKPGATVEAVITTPLCQQGASLPEGTTVQGVVKRVRKVGLGLIHETASLELDFDILHLPNGTDYPAPIRLVGIDNARERIDGRGAIHGMRATATISNRFGERLAFWAFVHPMMATPLFLAETGLFRFPDPEIEYRRGAELYLEIEFPESFRGLSPCVLPTADGSRKDLDDLQDLVDGLPYWSYSKRQPQPVDLVNLMFIGNELSLDAAFQAAGWTGSAPNSMRAGFGAIRAIVEDRSDGDAPMRMLLLDGERPDQQLQKTLNTFEKRHHLRVWNRPEQWQGRRVWASAATQDVGTKFSFKPFGFTHEIENDVDLERDKVVSDLVYTGCVDSVTYLRRQQGLRGPGQEYRKGVYTDSRVAVVVLNACRQPRLDVAAGARNPEPPLLVRCFRRVTLTARNHLLRDNIVWRSGDAALLGIHTLRDWRAQWKDERLARKLDSEPGESQAAEAGAAGLEYAPPPAEAGGWHLNPMVVTAR
ncbi:MAG: LssY C-terminal domain-containing protein [Bryobacteraceae bacterium]